MNEMTPQEILTKLQGLDGHDREVDLWLCEVLDTSTKSFHQNVQYLTASVDAALAFGEALLPGWGCSVFQGAYEFDAKVYQLLGLQWDWEPIEATHKKLPLAILIAYLTAWIEQQKEGA